MDEYRGLRHHDSFGPPGSGIVPGLPFEECKYQLNPFDGCFLSSVSKPFATTVLLVLVYPTYEGLDEGDETFLHIMASGASVGSPLYFEVEKDDFFSERSLLKLESTQSENNMLSQEEVCGLDKMIAFRQLETTNTVWEGDNAGLALDLQVCTRNQRF